MNHYAIAGFLTFFTSFVLGSIVYFKNPKRKTNCLFALFSISIAIYGFGFYRQAIALTEIQELIAIRILLGGTIFIPVFFLHLVYTILKKKMSAQICFSIYATAVILEIINFSTNWLAKSPVPKFGFRYLFQAGILYPVLMLDFSICVGIALWQLFHGYYSAVGIKRNQLKYIFFSTLIGFGGGSAGFMLGYNINLYPLNPFGTYCVALYSVIFTYAIVRYRLMDITVIVKKTFVFGALFGIVAAALYLPIFLWQSYLRSIFGQAWWIMPFIVFVFILFTAFPLYNSLVRITDKFLYQKKHDYQKTLKEASRGMVSITDPNRLVEVIARFINSKIRTTHVAILMWDEKNRHYILQGTRGEKSWRDIRLAQDSALIHWFEQTRDVVVKRKLLKKKYAEVLVHEELDSWLEDERFLDPKFGIEDELLQIKEFLEIANASVCIPSFYKGQLLGILILGDKLSGNTYTQEDFDILSTLANDAAIAFRNAQLFDTLYQEKKKIEILFKEMSDGVIMIDSDHTVIMINNAAIKMLQIEDSDIIGKQFEHLLRGFEFSLSLQHIAHSKEKYLTTEMFKNEGKPLYISNHISTIENEKGYIIGYVMILQDITEEKQEALIKRNFFSLISHKLRTPLTAVCGYTYLLKESKIKEEQKQVIIDNIDQQAKLLTSLVDKLLNFTLIVSDNLELELKRESLRVSLIIKFALNTIKSKLTINNTQIILDESLNSLPNILVDKDKICDVFFQLIENGIKFNDKEEKKIAISSVQEHTIDENQFVVIKVEDNGMGIPSDDYEKIFDKFYQIDKFFTGQVEGPGLGLSLVKRVIDVHGGRIWVKSTLGEGSTFYVTLPVAT